jgi:hypothetical protein
MKIALRGEIADALHAWMRSEDDEPTLVSKLAAIIDQHMLQAAPLPETSTIGPARDASIAGINETAPALVRSMTPTTEVLVPPSEDHDAMGRRYHSTSVLPRSKRDKLYHHTLLTAKTIEALSCWYTGCHEAPEIRGLCRKHYLQHEHSVVSTQAEIDAEMPPGSPLPMAEPLTQRGVRVHRKTECPAYDKCLQWALIRRWPSFSCKKCHGPRGKRQ